MLCLNYFKLSQLNADLEDHCPAYQRIKKERGYYYQGMHSYILHYFNPYIVRFLTVVVNVPFIQHPIELFDMSPTTLPNYDQQVKSYLPANTSRR